MNENNHHHPEQNLPVEQAPSFLMPALLTRLGLDRPGEAPAITPAELKTALADPDWVARASALQRLEGIRDRVSFALLLDALNDRDDSVRAIAVRILGQYGDPTNLTVLERLETAVRDPAWHVRETAVYALAAIGSYASIFVLREALRDSEDEVRLAALRAIRLLQSDMRVEQSRQASRAERSNRLRRFFHAATHFVPHSVFARERKISMLQEKHEAGEEQLAVKEEITIPDTLKKSAPARPAGPQWPWLRLLEQGLAAILVLGIVCGWLILSHLPRSGTGSPAAFSETGARSLGAPITTIHGNWSYVNEWSPDGHTLVTLQIDRQKKELEARIVDAATGHSTISPVLDSSWIAAVDAFDPVEILQGRYLVALQAHGKTQATMVIWDIFGQHAVTTQIVPARVPGGQVLSPFLFASQNEQKFAMYSPDGTVTIWDVASGEKIATCEGKFTLGQIQDIPRGAWYDHDRIFLLSAAPPLESRSWIAAWNTTTGTRLFSMSDTHKVYSRIEVSPDNQYLLLPIGTWQTSDNGHVITMSAGTLEILDAHSGKQLYSYHIESDTSFFWQPDSRHLSAISTQTSRDSGISSEQIASWDILTGQKTVIATFSNIAFQWTSPGGQYTVLGNPGGKVLQIWQLTTARHVATVATPGIYAASYSYSAISDRYMLIGLKGNFDIWDLATGKLVYKYHGLTSLSENNVSNDVFWSPNDRYLTMITRAGSTGNGSLTIWRMP